MSIKGTCFFIFIISLQICLFAQSNHNHALDKSSNRFIENKGQWSNDVRFVSNLGNAEVMVGNTQLYYILKDNTLYNAYMADLHDGKIKKDSLLYYQAANIKLSFLGADPKAIPRGKFPFLEKRNYLLGNDSSKWGKNVRSYPDIETANLYPNIDFKLYHSHNSIKYEFEVAPKTDYSQIKLCFAGHRSLEIAPNGDLLIHNGVSDIIEDRPLAYQYIQNEYKAIECGYKLLSDSTIGFDLGRKYNPKYPIVIDPQLIFSTASGSTADNWGNTACLDAAGNLYSGGTVFRTTSGNDGNPTNGFPSTLGAFQGQFGGGGTDIGILKFDSSGQNLIYATYIGGSFTEIPTSIVTNDKRELFILGVTSSANFPGAVNSFSGGLAFEPVGGYTFENGSDIIAIKLDATGSNIIKSRYVGGPYNDGDNMKLGGSINGQLGNINYGDELRGEIIIDQDENIYIASSTNNREYYLQSQVDNSPLFPVANAFQANFGGGFQDGVVFKIDASMDNLLWSSYIGSNRPDAAYSLALGKDRSVYVTGICGNPMFNTLDSAYKPTTIGSYDAYIAKIAPDGGSVLAYTYLGTPYKDASYFIQIDANEDVYVMGQTFGDYGHFPNTVYHNDREGIFIHKLDKKLQKSYFYTTIGDTLGDYLPNISPTAFLVNECGNIFISGWGGSTNNNFQQQMGYTFDMPISPLAYKKTSDGSDFYMAVYLQNMDSLLYATYFGVDGVGEHVDGGTSRFSDQGIVYQSVCAGCGGADFIVYPPKSEGDYPKQNASENCNNGVFKYDLSSLNAKIGVGNGCGPLTQYFVNETLGGVDYYWNFGDGNDTLVLTKETIEHKYQTPGKYRVSMVTTDLTTCKRRDSTFKFIYVSNRLIAQKIADTLCKGEIKIWDKYTDTNFTYSWLPTEGLSNPNIKNPMITGNSTIMYQIKLTDTLGCVRLDTFDLFVPSFIPNLDLSILAACQHLSMPKIEMKANYTSNFTPDSIFWKINTFEVTSYDSTFIFTPTQFGNQKVTVTTNIKECAFLDTGSINLPQIKVPNIITPNGDSKNDNFVIEGLEAGGKWTVYIANRWGKEIYKSTEYKNNWGATIEAPGTYFYEIEAPDKSKCKGWLQVVK